MKNNILTLLLKQNTLFIYSLVYWKLRLVWVLWSSFFLTIFKKTLHFFLNYRLYVSSLLLEAKLKTTRLKLLLHPPMLKVHPNFSNKGLKPVQYILDNLIQVQ